MQVEERKACPSCGTENPGTVDFCWKCYSAFASPTSTRPGMPRVRGRDAPSSVHAVVIGGLRIREADRCLTGGPDRRGSVRCVPGDVRVRFLFDRGPSLPDQLAGQPRLSTQAIRDFEEQMAAQGKDYDLKVAAAAYGTGATPAFLVMLVEGRAIESTDELFDSLVQGMAQGGATVNESATDSGERDGTEYRCVPFTGAAVEAAACMWRDDGTVGIVIDLSANIDETRELLFTVHGTVT